MLNLALCEKNTWKSYLFFGFCEISVILFYVVFGFAYNQF